MRVIQVGLGSMGNRWLQTVIDSPEVKHAGFVEIDPATAAAKVEQFNLDPALIFASLPEALNAVQPDGIIDVTPPQAHQTVSVTALEAGIPVLSEKPLADTLDSAQAIVDKSNETGVLHMVTQNYRYTAPAQTVKAALASGKLGRIGAAHIEFFKGPHFGGFRDEMDYPLIIDMAIHHFDMLRFFTGSDPVSIAGRSWNPAWSWYKGDASAAVTLAFEDDVVASYTGSWCSSGLETTWNANWRFECANGILWLRDDEVTMQLHNNEVSGDGAGFFVHEQPVVVEPVEMERIAQDYLLHEFYEAVTNGITPATTCQDNIKSLGIVFDTVRAFESGITIASSV